VILTFFRKIELLGSKTISHKRLYNTDYMRCLNITWFTPTVRDDVSEEFEFSYNVFLFFVLNFLKEKFLTTSIDC
jgi:hypothetical protein